ncbi:RICIN domain-containing protein [Saccharothrix luteola]|uniref:RICIN domain-containing protein n=1 Tax=Saccharothrix luteola TaxID=2893018 RepID=UPI001E3A318C|nr:RICIN domain-containing protein [Saccharothrix luteola]MCC8249998.1 RICIN domain-containing protein [Saccharothrix luteola]
MIRSGSKGLLTGVAAAALAVGGLVSASASAGTAPQPRSEQAEVGVQIVSRLSGLCLEVRGGNTANGGAVAMWTCTGGDGQRWESNGSEYRNVFSGRCLDVNDSNGANGAGLNQWDCQGQQWRFNGSELRNSNNKCLTIPAANRGNGAAVVMWDCVGAADQQWQIG